MHWLKFEKQVKRNREDWDASNESLPVVPTIASQFADAGVDQLWYRLVGLLNSRMDTNFVASEPNLGDDGLPKRNTPIPPERQGYLAEVASTVRGIPCLCPRYRRKSSSCTTIVFFFFRTDEGNRKTRSSG